MKKLLGVAVAFFYLSVTARADDLADLTQKLKDKDADTRRAAAKSLAEMGPEARPAVTALVASLKDRDLFVRRFSADALGAIGKDAQAAIPNLTAILRDTKERKEAQESAAIALGKIGGSAVNTLMTVVKDHDKDPNVRRAAVLGLSNMGTDAKSAIPTLVDELTGKDPKVGKKMPNPDSLKSNLVSALGEIATAKDSNAISAIENLIGGKNGKKDKNLVKTVQEAVKKIKART